MNWVSLSVQILPVLSSETFEVWVTTDMCPAVTSLHFPSNTLHVFLQYQQQQKIFLTIFWKVQQAGSRCSVRDSIAVLETTITICLQRKQWPTGRQQTHIVTARSTPPWWDMQGLSCRRVGARSLHTKRASRQQEANVRPKNPKQESQQNKNAFLLSRGQPMADFSHVYHISAIKQASLWDKGLTRRRKIAIVLEIIYYVLIK